MLLKYELIKKIKAAGIVAVVRGKSEDNSYKTAEACIKGNISAIELAFTSPNADVTIKRLADKHQNEENIIIGAGTVLDAQTARNAIIAGAKFIVGPTFNKEIAKLCNSYQIPYIPGCFSPTEIQTALMYGADVVKIFPSSVLGKNVIKELHGPFPYVNIMPTGGINLDNLKEWIDSGAFVVGVGGSLVGPGSTGDYQQVTENAVRFYECYAEIIDK